MNTLNIWTVYVLGISGRNTVCSSWSKFKFWDWCNQPPLKIGNKLYYFVSTSVTFCQAQYEHAQQHWQPNSGYWAPCDSRRRAPWIYRRGKSSLTSRQDKGILWAGKKKIFLLQSTGEKGEGIEKNCPLMQPWRTAKFCVKTVDKSSFLGCHEDLVNLMLTCE